MLTFLPSGFFIAVHLKAVYIVEELSELGIFRVTTNGTIVLLVCDAAKDEGSASVGQTDAGHSASWHGRLVASLFDRVPPPLCQGFVMLCNVMGKATAGLNFYASFAWVFRLIVLSLGHLLFIHALTNATDYHKYSPFP